MTRDEYYTLEPGDVVSDKFSKDLRIIKKRRFFKCDPDRFFGFVFKSLRPNGNFRNFQGRICPNRKETTICPYEAGRLTLQKKREKV